MESPTLRVNGRDLPLGEVAAHTTALDWLLDLVVEGVPSPARKGAPRASAEPAR